MEEITIIESLKLKDSKEKICSKCNEIYKLQINKKENLCVCCWFDEHRVEEYRENTRPK